MDGKRYNFDYTAGSETVPTAVEKWNKKFEELNLRNYIFVKCHESTSDSAQLFQNLENC